MFKLLVVGVLLQAEAVRAGVQESICYAPGVNRDKACTVCTDEKSGDACIRQGMVYACSATMESCCDQDGVVDIGSTYEECMNQFAPVRARSSRAVSNTQYTENEYCSEFWDNTNNNQRLINQFERMCHFEHFDLVNGQVQIWPAECFDNWVHGYAEPSEKAGFMTIEGVETPANCQTLCQLNNECKRFIWQAVDVQGGKKSGVCTLKNDDHINGAYDIQFNGSQNPSDYDSEYCDVENALKCWNNPKTCTYCEPGPKRCMWRSDKHISGWKYCGIRRTCPEEYTTPGPTTTPEPKTTTTTPTTTTTTTTPTTTTTTTPEPTTTTTTPEPTTTTTTTSEPTTTNTTPEPTTTTTTPEPTTTTTTPEPTTTTTTPEPTTTTTTPEPTTTTTTPEPTTTTTTPEPTTTTTTPEQTTETEEPITETEEPITETEEPITETEEPITETEEPITDTEEPITETEEPITVTEEPITEVPSTETPTECSSKNTDCHPACDNKPTENSDCRTPCDNCHRGVDLKIHEKPKLLRLAIDN